jgi:hypothetical protein
VKRRGGVETHSMQERGEGKEEGGRGGWGGAERLGMSATS